MSHYVSCHWLNAFSLDNFWTKWTSPLILSNLYWFWSLKCKNSRVRLIKAPIICMWSKFNYLAHSVFVLQKLGLQNIQISFRSHNTFESFMSLKICFPIWCIITHITFEWFFSSVNHNVFLKVVLSFHSFGTIWTRPFRISNLYWRFL